MFFKTLSLSLKLEDAGIEIHGVGSGVRLLPRKNGLDLPGSEDRHFLCTCDIDMLFFGIYSLGSCEYYGVSVASGSSHRIRGTGGGFGHCTWGSCQMAGHSSEAKHIPTYTAEADSLHRECREVDVRQLACLFQSSRCCHGLTMERLLLGRSSIFRFARQENNIRPF